MKETTDDFLIRISYTGLSKLDPIDLKPNIKEWIDENNAHDLIEFIVLHEDQTGCYILDFNKRPELISHFIFTFDLA